MKKRKGLKWRNKVWNSIQEPTLMCSNSEESDLLTAYAIVVQLDRLRASEASEMQCRRWRPIEGKTLRPDTDGKESSEVP
jgi:hypothetical protein